eukprot:548997_1
MRKGYNYIVRRHDPMEDENENDKEEKGSSVSYPVGGSSSGGDGSSSFARTTTPYSSRGVGGCYSWGGVTRNGGASYAGPVDTDHQVKTDNDAGNIQRNPEGALLMNNIPSPPVAMRQGVVVMDGANIAWGWGISHPNLLGISKALDWFESRLKGRAPVIAFLPTSYIFKEKQREVRKILQSLLMSRKLILVPKLDNDDSYIISFAYSKEGWIVSNDLFRDAIEKEKESQQKHDTDQQEICELEAWLAQSRVSFVWVGDAFMPNPDHKLIRWLCSSPSSPSVAANNYSTSEEKKQSTTALLTADQDSVLHHEEQHMEL